MNKGEHMTMKDLPVSERPYEKLINHGSQILSDAELLAVVFRTGSRNERAVEIAQRLLNINPKNPGLNGLYDLSIKELQKVKGIGTVKALQVQAIIELSKRLASYRGKQLYKVTSPSTIASIYMEEMRYLKQEHFKIIMLDTKNQIIYDKDITIGSINASIVHPREVFKEAIEKSAVHIILLHNHPSGDPTPSKEDIHVTERLIECGEIIGIQILDHIIIGDGKYNSLKEQGIC